MKIFIDTNILIYTLDQYNPQRQKQSRQILQSIQKHHHGVISTQVVQEFYVVAVNKLQLDPLQIKNILFSLENFEIVTIQSTWLYQAVDCSILNRVSFWDALIVTAALQANCQEVWTEDLNAGQVINGVKIYNPYKTTE